MPENINKDIFLKRRVFHFGFRCDNGKAKSPNAVVFGVAILTNGLGVVRVLGSSLDFKIAGFVAFSRRRLSYVRENKHFPTRKVRIVQTKLEDFSFENLAFDC